jgi:type I restriction enzyme, S subunit
MSVAPSAVWVEPTRLRPSRLAAEYYRKEYAELEDRLERSSLRLEPLGQLGRLFTGPFGSELPASLYHTPQGIPLLRVQNIGELFLNEDDLARIPQSVHKDLFRSKLEPGDLALAKAGRLGALSAIPSHIPECNITQHIVGVKVDTGRICGSYLAAFFLSRFGNFQLKRQGIGTLIKYLGIEETRAARVPLPNSKVQNYIGAKIELAERCRSRAGALRAAAVSRFNALLRLPAFGPGQELTNLIEANALTGRLSGEFYLPRYLALEAHLASLTTPVKPLRSLLRSDILRSSTPERSGGAPVACVLTSDIDPHDIRWRSPSLRVTQSVHDGHTGRLAALDVVYTSVGPPVGEAALVLPRFLPMAAGGDVSILRHGDDLHPGYLALYLNSVFGQMQNDRYSRGIRQRRVYPEDIGSFLIPVFSPEDQQYVGERIVRHQVLNELAVDLVNEAKADVDALIDGTLDLAGILSGKIESPTEDAIPELSEATA